MRIFRATRALSLTILLSFAPAFLCAESSQENAPSPTESAQTETAPSETAQTTEPPQEAAPAADTDDTKKPRSKYNPIVFVKDLLDEKLPLHIDFGAEPHRHGSMIFGAALYDWSENFSQSLRGEYDHYSTSSNSNDSLTNTEVRSVALMTSPIVFFIGDSDIRARTPFSQFNIGLYFQYSYSTTNTGSFFSYSDDDENPLSSFYITDLNQTYRVIGPSFGYSLKVPVHKYISFSAEGFIVPAFLITLYSDSETTYHYGSADTSDTSSLTFRSLSYPYIKQSIAFDFFRYIRIKAQMTYQHFDLRAIVSESESNASYSLHTITLRYGGELLKPSKTRKKSAHLWAGFYYEMTWNKMYLSDDSATEYTGKWVLCFGT